MSEPDADPTTHAPAGEAGGLRWGSVCITGDFRENNEDRVAVDPDGGFFVVADGMGGQSAGEKASELAVTHLCQTLRQQTDRESGSLSALLKEAVAGANAEIVALGNVEPEYHGMGTTVVFLVPAERGLVVGHLGDSRCYRLRDGGLEQLTKDHSLTQALIDAGTITAEEAKTHRYKNMLFRYLGSKEGSEGADTAALDLRPGDRYMLCSDGVTDGLPDEAIARTLGDGDDPQAMAESLVQQAVAGGSRDNVTCVVVLA